MTTDLHSDTALLERWFAAQRLVRPEGRGGHPRWHVVSETFCIGSTAAAQVCRRHKVDPDELVRMRR